MSIPRSREPWQGTRVWVLEMPGELKWEVSADSIRAVTRSNNLR